MRKRIDRRVPIYTSKGWGDMVPDKVVADAKPWGRKISWEFPVKRTVSRDGRGMLLYIFRKLLKNAIASDEKNWFC